MRGPHCRNPVVAGPEQVRTLPCVDHDLSFQYVEAVLVAVDVPWDPATRLELDQGEPGVNRARYLLVDDRPAAQTLRAGTGWDSECRLNAAPDQVT
jgi:hypothetical protein